MYKNKTLMATAIGGIAIIISSITFYSCMKDFNKPFAKMEYTPLIAAPVINSSMMISDLLKHDKEKGNIQIDKDNFITLVYRGRLFSLEARDFIKFPSQTYPTSTPNLTSSDINTFNALPLGGTFPITPSSQSIVFNTNNTADIDSIIFKTGTLMNVVVTSQFKHDATINFSIPGAKKNGVPFSKTIVMPFAGQLPVTSVSNFDLTGYTFDMTKGGTTQNTIDIRVTATLKKLGNSISTSDRATITVGFTNPLFQKMFGYIRQPLISPKIDTVHLSIFDNAMPGGGSFTILNPIIHILVHNSYGVPIDATFNLLKGYNPGYPPYTISVGTEPKLNPWHLPYPLIAQMGQYKQDSVLLSNTNTSNTLAPAVNNHPKRMVYQINAKANPLGKPIPPNTNFALDTSKVIVDFQLDLPLYGTAGGMMMYDTIPFTMKDINLVESVLFRLYAENGFPVDMGIQGFFTDSVSPLQKYHVLDSLITPYQSIMPAAGVDAGGKVNTPSIQTTDITYSKARMSGIKKANKLILRGKFNTTNNGKTNVKMYADYKLKIKVGVMVQVKTKI